MQYYNPDQLDPSKLVARIARARSVIGKGILYGLGHGGNDPEAPKPSDNEGLCDCSAFALCWLQGLARKQEGRGKTWSKYIPWINTDSVVADARGKQSLFVLISRPFPGCVAVYGASETSTVGHCGLITAVQNDLEGKPTKLTGIDCHGGYTGHKVRAIEEHDLTYFLKKQAIFVALKADLS